MLYLDTALVVSLFIAEQATDRVQAWVGRQEPGGLFVSNWVIAEFSSALSMKLRTGKIGLDERARILARFSGAVSTSFSQVEIEPDHFLLAARFADNHATGLRASDALHLAIASQHGLTLCTLDKILASAGQLLGVTTELV